MIRLIFGACIMIGSLSNISLAAVGPESVRTKCKEIVTARDVLKFAPASSSVRDRAAEDEKDGTKAVK
jgi:hypothetical protein